MFASFKLSFFTRLFVIGISHLILVSTLEAEHFPFESPREMYLIPGMEAVNHPVTTNNPEAQRFFNQGLTFKYAFNHDASFWSFQKAAQLDPEMAMAYWGMALAVGSNINSPLSEERGKVAYENIQKALKLSHKVTENEKAYILALSQRYSNEPNRDQSALDLAYKNAMKAIVNRFSEDLDAATLYAESVLNLNPWHQWTQDGKPLPNTMDAVDTLESVLKRDQLHLGANHYYIHAIEASKYPERALMSAERLRKILPASGHILHMPAHIYILVGDYHQAAQANEEAVSADLEYIRQFGMDGTYPLHYLSHNYYFMARAYSLEGNYEKAIRAANDLQAFYVPHFNKMPELEEYATAPQLVLLRFNRWDDILKLKPFPENMNLSNTLLHFAKAYALASMSDVEEAKKEQALFLEGNSKLSSDQAFGYNHASMILKIAELQLEAKIAYAQGKTQETIDLLKRGIDLQDVLNYNEPPDWYYSIRESLGAVLLTEGRFIEAQKVFKTDLDFHPGNGRSLLGLAESLKIQKKDADAFWVQKEFDEAWKYSTQPLTISDLFFIKKKV
jgi:hypothetical protein